MLSETTGCTKPISDASLGDALRATAAHWPDKLALVSLHQDLRLTWKDLFERVETLAGGLLSLGLRPGDRVGIWACNCAEWIYLQFAAARVGVVTVNVNPALGELDLGFVLRHAGLRVLFVQANDERKNYEQIFENSGGRASVESLVVLGSARWQALFTSALALPARSVSAEEVVNVQYTSGSTGNPKGVLLTHTNVVSNALALAEALGIGPDDVLCAQVPMHHCFGYVVSSLLCAVTGMTLVFPAARFDPRATLQAIESERCTVIHGVPTMFAACLDHGEFSRFELGSLRTGIMAGAPCPIELVKRVIVDMKCTQMTVAYGQTEASPAVTISDAGADLLLRTETVGRAMTNTEVRIVDASGKIAPKGEVGELCARGPGVMRGYDQDPVATARAIDAEGWLRTGDLALMRPDGYLSIKGRLTEMIIRGGENIYPKEVEDVLSGHPKVAECCVVGIPDRRFGEAVLAWVRAKPGQELAENELEKFCENRIARFKIPTLVRSVPQFPLTSTGKVNKRRIQELEIEALGLGDVAALKTA
jgi:fatty-acyl-CoA synthase